MCKIGPKLPFEVSHATAVNLEGRFLLVGGEDENNLYLNTIIEMDSDLQKWKIHEPFKEAIKYPMVFDIFLYQF